MANKKISELTAGAVLVGDENVPMEQGGNTKRTTPSEISRLDHLDVPANLTSTTYTFSLSDLGTWIRSDTATLQTITVPDEATVDVPVGRALKGVQAGAGKVFFDAASGVVINIPVDKHTRTRIQGAWWELRKVGADEWDLIGDLDVP